MEKQYVTPKLDITEFETEDVITTSSDIIEDGSED